MNGSFPNYFSVIKDICTKSNIEVDDKILHSLDEKRISAKSQPYRNISIEIVDALKELKKKGLKLDWLAIVRLRKRKVYF